MCYRCIFLSVPILTLVFHIFSAKHFTADLTFTVHVPLNSMCKFHFYSTWCVQLLKEYSPFNSKIWKGPLLHNNVPPPPCTVHAQHVPLLIVRFEKIHFYSIMCPLRNTVVPFFTKSVHWPLLHGGNLTFIVF